MYVKRRGERLAKLRAWILEQQVRATAGARAPDAASGLTAAAWRLVAARGQCPPDAEAALLQRFFRRESALLRKRRAAVHVSEFSVLSCIGRGAFGEVRPGAPGCARVRLGARRSPPVPSSTVRVDGRGGVDGRQVFLAVKSDSGEVAAIKRIRKSFLLERHKVRRARETALVGGEIAPCV